MNKITKIKLTEDRQSNIDIINFLGNKKEYFCKHIGNMMTGIHGYSKIDEKEYMESNMNTFTVKFHENKKEKTRLVTTQGNCIW